MTPVNARSCGPLALARPGSLTRNPPRYSTRVATLLGCREKRNVAFHVTMVTARGERVQVSLNGGDMYVPLIGGITGVC